MERKMDESNKQSFSIDDVKPQVSPIMLFVIFLVVIWGVVLGLIILPAFLPGLSQSILASKPKIFWYLSRGSALVAYGLLWFSMVLGVGVTNKLATRWPGLGKTNELHQFISILGLAFGLFHGLILLGDAYSHFTLAQRLLPFATTTYRPFAVGLGQIGFYLWAVVLGSFYVRKKIGTKSWRFIHYFSYLTFLGVLVHSLMSGTDAGLQATQLYYWITGGLLLFLTVYRVIYEIETHAEKKEKLAAIREINS
jgi:predicted ferric reductase